MLAATVVLTLVTLVALVILPANRRAQLARDAVASALQVQNWNLAFGTTGYEQAGGPVSIVRHFWSLAVEEQFYLVVPLLILLVVGSFRSRTSSAPARRRRLMLTTLSLILTASLVHSILWSTSTPDIAYFATTTRLWELLAGGILAIAAPALGRRAADAAFLTGVLLIAWSAATYTTELAFPGWIAVVPVAGSLLMLWAGSAHPEGLVRVLALRPAVFVGDISYSLYLWRWPVIVLFLFVVDRPAGVADVVGMLLLSGLLAWGSTRFIELPLNRARTTGRRVHG